MYDVKDVRVLVSLYAAREDGTGNSDPITYPIHKEKLFVSANESYKNLFFFVVSWLIIREEFFNHP